MPLLSNFIAMESQITEWRQDFHRHPELLFDVHRTAEIVETLLRSFGCDEVVNGLGRTGVVGVIHGRENTSGTVIGLRADMDALPIEEETGLEYASTVPGLMHACGHDGHTAMLLGACKYLAETRNFNGTAIAIFQPAEEGGGGGLEMINDGLMERWNIKEVYGMHNWPGIPVGGFAVRPGPILAAADRFDVTITGVNGHAARPHDCIDPNIIVAQIIMALQTIVSRNVDPMENAVVSVASIDTDSEAFNIIPSKVTMNGTVRTMKPHVRDLIEMRLREIVERTALVYNATASVEYSRGYPPTVNSSEHTEYAIAVANTISSQVDPITPARMGAEDFAYMLERRPGVYILVGNGDTAAHHNSKFNFDDRAGPYGANWFAGMIEARAPLE